MDFVEATVEHIDGIAALLNQSYRTNQGWTNEFQLVSGDRASPSMIRAMLGAQSVNSQLFVQENEVIGCIFTERFSEYTEIGTFAISPSFQCHGLGRRLLSLAERWCIENHNSTEFRMSVLSSRFELIDFYLRRGYKTSLIVKPYPLMANVGVPLVQDLSLVVLIKTV